MKFRRNDEEFPFELTTHGAWMLISGINRYVSLIDRLYRTKIETADYCFLMTCTAHDQAVKVREWAVKNKMQNIKLDDLDCLIDKIVKRREKFMKLEYKMMLKEKKNSRSI